MKKLLIIWEIVFLISVSTLALSLYIGVCIYYLIKPKKNEKK
jgi:hypothetical protein